RLQTFDCLSFAFRSPPNNSFVVACKDRWLGGPFPTAYRSRCWKSRVGDFSVLTGTKISVPRAAKSWTNSIGSILVLPRARPLICHGYAVSPKIGQQEVGNETRSSCLIVMRCC